MPLSDRCSWCGVLIAEHPDTDACAVADEAAARANADPLRARVAELEDALDRILDQFNRDNIGPGQAAFYMADIARAALAQPPVVTATGVASDRTPCNCATLDCRSCNPVVTATGAECVFTHEYGTCGVHDPAVPCSPSVTATGADVEHRLAPWTEDEVAALVRRQGDGNFHPYTCGVGTGGHPPLVPSREGWVCLACDYRQAWAHTADTITPPAIPPTSDGAVEGPWCRWTDGTHGCVAPESDVCHRRGHVEYRHDWRPIPAPDASVEP